MNEKAIHPAKQGSRIVFMYQLVDAGFMEFALDPQANFDRFLRAASTVFRGPVAPITTKKGLACIVYAHD